MLVIFCCLNGLAPIKVLADVFRHVTVIIATRRPLRSALSANLDVPRFQNTGISDNLITT